MGHFALSVLLLVLAVAAPASAQVDCHAQLRALTRDLATTIEATADKLHAQGVEGYAPGSNDREAIGRVSATLEQLSKLAAPPAAQVERAGFVLGGLVESSPELYASVINEPTMLARIHSAEKNMGMKVFVPPALVSQGIQILIDLVEFSKVKGNSGMSAPAENQSTDEDYEEWDEILKELRKTEQRLVSDNFANRYFAVQLANFIYRIYGELYSKKAMPAEALTQRSMAYMLEAESLAYQYYRMHAYDDNG